MNWVKSHSLVSSFIVFIILNVFVYLSIYFFHSIIPFNKYNYVHNFHHYEQDPRIDHKAFSFFSAIGQADAQWYLKLADNGYPFHPHNTNDSDRVIMDGLSYAFFPLYPLLLNIFHRFIPDLDISAFILTNIILIINFFSLYKLISYFYPKRIVLKTLFLFFLFPFSIFYRSYFPEGIFLFLIIWSTYFFIQKKYFWTSMLLGLLLITKGNGVLLVVLFLSYIFRKVVKKELSWQMLLFDSIFIIIPLLLWSVFCFFQTSNPFYFVSIHNSWFSLGIFNPLTIIYNIWLILHFFNLPLHDFHYSQLDVSIILFFGVMLILSFKKLPKILWIISFSLWLFPLLVTDTQSFSRFQSVSFPIFIYLTSALSSFYYRIVLLLFSIAFFFIVIAFVNWYWIG